MTVTLPFTGIGAIYSVDWDDDGNYDESTSSPITHTYSTQGNKTIAAVTNNAKMSHINS